MAQIFCDGTKVFKQFTLKYETHKKGFFIVAPSGAGKTYFVKNQKKLDWIDGDELWTDTGAQPLREWWTEGTKTINEIDQKCDIITSEAKKLGLWIIGASNYWLIPDAMVIPDWQVNKKYIIQREKNNYDGGAKSKDFEQVLGHRKILIAFAKKNKVKIFKTIEAAVSDLIKKI